MQKQFIITTLIALTLIVGVFAFSATVNVGVAQAADVGDPGDGGCCGSDGDGDSPTPTTPTTPSNPSTPTPVIPVCDLNAKPVTINEGDSSKLTWTAKNAINTATINQGVGEVNANNKEGFRNVSPKKTTTYVMTVKSRTGKAATCAAKVTVIPKPVAPTCVLKADKTTVTAGSEVRLSWTSTNSVSGRINQYIGAVDPRLTSAVRVVKPTENTTYILTVENAAGKPATCSKTIIIKDTPEVPTPSCVLYASKTSILKGESSKLTWTISNANSASIDQAVGGVDVDEPNDFRNVSPLVGTTYTMTVKNSAGVTAICAKAITVTTTHNDSLTCEDNVNFRASDYSIEEGQSSTLTWDTTGVDSVRINNGVNSTNLDGSESVSPRSNTTYILTATKGNDSVSCPLTIDVDEDNGGGGGGGSSSPKCTLKISDNKISLGERVTIKWDTTRATEVTLKDNHGKTLVDTDDKSSSEKKDLYDGEITIRPERDTTYTLVAEKGSRDKTCKVEVDVEDTIVVTQIRDQQPLVTGIALTQVPYTGFEAGPFMTSVFYTLLAAWALYMAYVLVGRRNGMNASAFTPARVLSEIVPSTAMFPASVTAAPVFYQTAEPVVATTATVGYAAHVEASTAIEAQAHAAHVLLSSDAIAYFIAATDASDRESILSGVLAAAKASYPSEDGWVVVSADRMVELASKY